MFIGWLVGFFLGNCVCLIAREYDYTCAVHLSGFYLFLSKISCVLGLWLTNAVLVHHRFMGLLFITVIAAVYAGIHFDSRLQFGLLATPSALLNDIHMEGIRELHRFDPQLADWINSIVWGNVESIPSGLRQDFKVSGLYHILSVSGGHISTLVVLLRFLLLIPFRGMYIAYLLPGHLWFALRSLTPLLGIPILLAYLQAIGCPQAAVRATFLGVSHLFGVFQSSGRTPAYQCLQTLFLQSLVVPEEFFSCGNLMSWMGYLCIIDCLRRPNSLQSFLHWPFVSKVFQMQMELIGWAVVCFGQLSLIGIPANFLLAPIFGPVFWGAITLALFPSAVWLAPLPLMQSWFLKGVSWSATAAEAWPWLYMTGDQIYPSLRVAVALGCTALMLRRIVRLSNPSKHAPAIV